MAAPLRIAIAAGMMPLAVLAGCSPPPESADAAPPRASDPIAFPEETSTLAVALALDLRDLERRLEREVPRRLWDIHEDDAECLAPHRVDLAVLTVKSPRIRCDIDGEVTRGRLKVAGRGRELVVTMPVDATVRAHDIAGVLKGKTASAAAEVRLAVRLDLEPGWRVTGKPQVGYRWSREPGIDFLGRRITFTEQADRELAGVRAGIERTLAQELARLPLRAAAEQGWRSAHSVLELNRKNPEVWARITPERVRFGGYRVEGRRIVATLGLDAKVETRLGTRPDAPAPAPLPPLAPLAAVPGRASLHLPIIADYAVLEPVVTRALAKRAARPFALGEYGSVTAAFGKATVYGTEGGRIAVGVPFSATTDLAMLPKAQGTIWLTARPLTQPGSREVAFADVAITGETSLASEKLLFALANSAEFQAPIAAALHQNFERDFAGLLARIDRALARRTDGPLAYRVELVSVQTGAIAAHGEGLYLPVDVEARIAADTLRID